MLFIDAQKQDMIKVTPAHHCLMTPTEHDTLLVLREAGYFRHAEDGFAAIDDMVHRYGLEAALFSPASGRAVLLSAEDLADGGAGMGIQQVRLLLARRAIAIDAADSEEYDDESGSTILSLNGASQVLFDWSFAKRAMPDDLAHGDYPTALRDLLWKSRVQGFDLKVHPCEHGSAGVDLHLQLRENSRFFAHWGQGFDDGRVLHTANFFTIVNRLLAQLQFAERLYAWLPFSNGQTGVFLDATLFGYLQDLDLTTHLRRIDAID